MAQRAVSTWMLGILFALTFVTGCSKAPDTKVNAKASDDKKSEAQKESTKEGAAGGDQPEGPLPVTVETAVRGAIDRVVTADAVLYPYNQANVTPKIAAPVRRVSVNRGDHVRAGQLLAELEGADLASAVEEAKHQYELTQSAYNTVTRATVREDQGKAQADVQAARETFEAAKKVYESRLALQKEGALAQRLVDESRVAMMQAQIQLANAQRHLDTLDQVSQRESIRGAEAQMNAAKSHLDSASVQLSYTQVRSPINGVVADRPVYPGEMAVPGTPLVSLVDISQLTARANVPVRDAALIRVGRPARITGPDGDLAGRVTVVSPAVDPSTTTLEVWVQVANPGEKLKPGGTVRVSIIAETIQNTLIVPATALLNLEEGGQKVMMIDKDLVAHERKITIGVRQGPRVQIIAGVSEGDKVVTSGGLGLEDNAKVKLVTPKADDEDEDDK